MNFIVDDSKFPLVFVVYPASVLPGALESFEKDLRAVYQRGPLAVIVDVSAVNPTTVSALDRKELASRMDSVTRDFPNTIISEAVVFSSTIIRGMYMAYNWVKQDKSYPSKSFSSVEQARVWSLQMIKKHRPTNTA